MVKKTLRSPLVRFVTLFIFLIYIYSLIDFNDFKVLLKTINFYYIGVALVLYSLSYVFRAIRYTVLFRGYTDIDFKTSLELSLVHAFYNRILPARLGEASYIFFLNREKKVPVLTGTITLLTMRIYDFITCIVFFMIGISALNKDAGELMIPLLVISVLLVLFILFTPELLAGFNTLLLRGEIPVFEKLRKWLVYDKVEMRNIFGRSKCVVLLLCTSAIWISLYFMFFTLIVGFDIALPLLEIFFGVSFAVVTNLLPISGLGGFGTMEIGWIYGFTQLGVDQSVAASSGLLSNIFTFVATLLFGGLGFILKVVRYRKDGKLNEANNSNSLPE